MLDYKSKSKHCTPTQLPTKRKPYNNIYTPTKGALDQLATNQQSELVVGPFTNSSNERKESNKSNR